MSNPRSALAASLQEILAPLGVIVGGLQPLDVPLPWAPEVLGAFIELERLAQAGKVLMAARAAESNEWARAGFPTAADWLAMQSGTSTGRAKADLGTSERLGELPLTADEVRAGNLSAEQADVVADAAVVNPAAERDLLDLSRRESLRHMREEAARRKAQAERDAGERERKVRERRSARWWVKDGEWNFRASGPLVAGADIERALGRRISELFKERRNDRESRDNYAFDALHDLTAGERAAEPGGTGSAGGRPRRRGPITRLTLVRADLAALIRGRVGDGEVCEIDGVGPISVSEGRRLIGEGALSLVITDGQAVVNVVNLSRKPTAAQTIAKLWTDPKCVVEGCNRTIRLELDHREDWHRTKHTMVEELERMCDHDHDLKTYENYQLVPGTGRRALVPPGHPLHPDSLRDTG
ncbi:MAG: hypothetical protein U0Q22_05455 [Acidimicrobiales bacterium]